MQISAGILPGPAPIENSSKQPTVHYFATLLVLITLNTFYFYQSWSKVGTVNKSTVQFVNDPLSFSFKLDLYIVEKNDYIINFSVAAGLCR